MSTERVRISVYVDENGQYCAAGHTEDHGDPSSLHREWELDNDLEGNVKCFFLDLEVELPEPKTIQCEYCGSDLDGGCDKYEISEDVGCYDIEGPF